MDAANAAITSSPSRTRDAARSRKPANAQTMNMLQLQLMNVGQNLNSAQQDKTMLETQLENNRDRAEPAQASLEET